MPKGVEIDYLPGRVAVLEKIGALPGLSLFRRDRFRNPRRASGRHVLLEHPNSL